MIGARIAALAGLCLALIVVTTTPAWATWLTVTNCETVTIDGHEYGKITFDISNHAVGPNFGVLDDLVLTPYPPNSPPCPLVQVSLPAGWASFTYPSGLQIWYATTPAGFVYPGQTLSGIQIVLSQPQCCYAFQPNPVLLGYDLFLPVCFACPGVTPAGESTWGRLKTQYR